MTSKKQQKDFDSVQLMRTLRRKISQETSGMGYEEERKYIRERLRKEEAQSESSSTEKAA